VVEVELVVAGGADDHVVPAAGVDGVHPRSPDDGVVSGVSEDRAGVVHNRVVAGPQVELEGCILKQDDPRAVAGARRALRICIDREGARLLPDPLGTQEVGRWLARRVGWAAGHFQGSYRRAGHRISHFAVGARQALQLEDIEIVPGSGAVPFNRQRFGGRTPEVRGEAKASGRPRRK
jgi:hypothetical protein